MQNGAVAGFKYFDMQGADTILIEIRGTAEGKMQVSDTPDFSHLCCEADISAMKNEHRVLSAKLNIEKGKRALYFRFEGKGVIDFLSFELAESSRKEGNK